MGSLYSKVTHVANAYDKDIWTHVGGDQWYMKSTSAQGTVGTRGTAGRRSPSLIHKWNNLTLRYAGLIPPAFPSS